MSTLGRAAFGSASLSVTRRDIELEFPHLPAATWLSALSVDHYPMQVLSLMDPDSYDRFLDAVEDHRLTIDDIEPLAHQAIAEAAGRSWWEAVRLVGAVTEPSGRLLGELTLSGVRPRKVSLAEYCAAVWAALTKDADTMGLMKLESQLTVPPAGASEEDLSSFDDNDFAAMAQRLQSLPGTSIG